MQKQMPESFDVAQMISWAIGRGHCKAMGIQFGAIGPNWCELSLPYSSHLAGDDQSGILASGAIVALMDMAAGMAVLTTRRAFGGHVTLDLRVDYPRPATPGRTVYGRCECYRTTKSVAFIRGLAHDGDPEKPIAHVAATFMLIEAGR